MWRCVSHSFLGGELFLSNALAPELARLCCTLIQADVSRCQALPRCLPSNKQQLADDHCSSRASLRLASPVNAWSAPKTHSFGDRSSEAPSSRLFNGSNSSSRSDSSRSSSSSSHASAVSGTIQGCSTLLTPHWQHHQQQNYPAAASSFQLLQQRSLFSSCPHQPNHHLQQLYHHQQQQQAHQLQQQRGVKQLRPYAEAPKLPPKFKRPDRDGRMNRMVVRVPPQVQLAVEGGKLTLTGKAGSTSLCLSTLDPSGLVAWQCLSQSAAAAAAGPGTGSLLLLVSPSKRHWRSIQTHIDNAVHGVMQGYLVGVTVQGVGYRLEPVADEVVKAAVRARRGEAAAEDSSIKRRMFWELEAEKSNIAYPHKQPAKAVRLKVGYTKAAIFPLPEGVLGFFVKPTLMYLYGVDKQLVTNTAASIRAVRKPNAYTGNGIQLVGEKVRLKQRAGSK